MYIMLLVYVTLYLPDVCHIDTITAYHSLCCDPYLTLIHRPRHIPAGPSISLYHQPIMGVGWLLSVIYLRKHRTGMNRTNHILICLLSYSINTSAVTSFFAILVVIITSGRQK
ncbi:hypothetical protein C8R48DRAFT_736339 [Suillus tomentosus]|nr:hypothetical protein C8R48DRAFT_736339 [Suillus tomentosus]